jgi:hypothetical protein
MINSLINIAPLFPVAILLTCCNYIKPMSEGQDELSIELKASNSINQTKNTVDVSIDVYFINNSDKDLILDKNSMYITGLTLLRSDGSKIAPKPPAKQNLDINERAVTLKPKEKHEKKWKASMRINEGDIAEIHSIYFTYTSSKGDGFYNKTVKSLVVELKNP